MYQFYPWCFLGKRSFWRLDPGIGKIKVKPAGGRFHITGEILREALQKEGE
jgi:hypothetical protein